VRGHAALVTVQKLAYAPSRVAVIPDEEGEMADGVPTEAGALGLASAEAAREAAEATQRSAQIAEELESISARLRASSELRKQTLRAGRERRH
jgi:hypothetical protein